MPYASIFQKKDGENSFPWLYFCLTGVKCKNREGIQDTGAGSGNSMGIVWNCAVLQGTVAVAKIVPWPLGVFFCR